MKKEENKVTFKVGCVIPIIALICLLAVLELIKWKTALIIGLFILVLPLLIWLLVAILILIVGLMSGTIAIKDKFKRK